MKVRNIKTMILVFFAFVVLPISFFSSGCAMPGMKLNPDRFISSENNQKKSERYKTPKLVLIRQAIEYGNLLDWRRCSDAVFGWWNDHDGKFGPDSKRAWDPYGGRACGPYLERPSRIGRFDRTRTGQSIGIVDSVFESCSEGLKMMWKMFDN